MPMLGVISETLEREGGSIRGEEDFFSVARTMPFVAGEVRLIDRDGKFSGRTFDTQRCDTLIYSIERIFLVESVEFQTAGAKPVKVVYLSEQVFHSNRSA
jgi:hypothetical protein